MRVDLFHLALRGLILLTLPRLASAFSELQSQHGRFPYRILGGVSVIDTPIIRAAQRYARDHGEDTVYNHIIRS